MDCAGWVTAWSGVGVSVQLASPRWVVGHGGAEPFPDLGAGGFRWCSVARRCSRRPFPLRERRESEPDPLEEFDAPAVAREPKPRSGLIVVNADSEVIARTIPI